MKNKINVLLIVAVALTMAGCGGSSGGSGSSSAVRPNIDVAASAAARATPKQGSVIQSNVNNKPGLGVESTKSTVTFNNIAGQTSFTPAESDVVESDTLTEGGVTLVYKGYEPTVENNGYLFIGNVSLDYGSGANDYLAFGLWSYEPTGASSLADTEFGFYTDGGDPFIATNINGLIGTASYEGVALGVYTESGEDEFGVLYEGEVSLNADFDTNKISGRIDELEAIASTDPVELDGDPVVNLLDADISTTLEGGFWTGDTSVAGTTDGSTYAGKWGGQFYGNGASDTDHPEYAAGTFGGAGTNPAAGDSSFVGGYIAEKQP